MHVSRVEYVLGDVVGARLEIAVFAAVPLVLTVQRPVTDDVLDRMERLPAFQASVLVVIRNFETCSEDHL